MTQATFRQQYTIPYFLCDRKQTIRLSMLVNYMLKVSGEQTAQIASEQQQTFFVTKIDHGLFWPMSLILSVCHVAMRR